MKLRANRAELADAVAWVCRVVAKNPQHPALAGVRLRTESFSGALLIEGTNFEVGHTATMNVEIGDEGDVLVSGHFLRDLLGALKTEAVDLYVSGNALAIASGRSLYHAQLMEVADYPTLAAMPATVGSVAADDLSRIVEAVSYPIDDAAPVETMRGLRLEGSEDELVAVGLIHHAVASAGTEWERHEDFAVTMPLSAIAGAIKGFEGAVVVACDDSGLGLADMRRQITARPFAGQYAPWQRVLAAAGDPTFTAVCDPTELLAATKRAMIVAGDSTIDMSFNEGEIVLSVVGAEAGDGREVVEADCEGTADFRIGPRYLIDALAAIPSGRVAIGVQVAETIKPLTFKPLDHPRMTSLLQPRKTPGGAR